MGHTVAVTSPIKETPFEHSSSSMEFKPEQILNESMPPVTGRPSDLRDLKNRRTPPEQIPNLEPVRCKIPAGCLSAKKAKREGVAILSARGSALLKNVRHMALDMDGTIYSGSTLFGDTVQFLTLLNELGMGHTFLTNNSSKSVMDYVAHLRHMGISAGEKDLFTSTHASIDYLRQQAPRVRRLFVLGTQSMREEIAAAGFIVTKDDPLDEPDAVLVGFDTELTFARLCRAAYWIKKGKPFIASHPDRICPTDQPVVLVDCGSVCAALKEATGRGPDAVPGKPNPRMLQGLLHQHHLFPETLAMVGDRLYTDLEMARRTGAVGILVLTGETTLEEAREAAHPPDLIVSNLAALGRKLQEAKDGHRLA